MTKRRSQKKRNLSSPDNGNRPEKKSSSGPTINTTTSECNTVVNTNTMASPGFVQPLNLANMNNYTNYQTSPGSYFPLQTPTQTQTQAQPQPQQFANPGIQHVAAMDQQAKFQQAILDRLCAMDQKLNKLDTIENQLSSMSKKMASMETRISSLESASTETKDRLGQIENSRAFDSKLLEDIKSAQTKINSDIQRDKDRVEQMSRDYKNVQSMNEDILDLQSRSMRDNLLFMGFPEPASFEERREEDCVKTVLEFCAQKLKLSDAESTIKIERAHRMGKYNADRKRPIVVKFNHYPDKMLVKKRASAELSGSDRWVTEQYPRPIQDRRKILIEAMKKARAAGKRASVSYDKLYIDGKMYTVDNLASSGFSS